MEGEEEGESLKESHTNATTSSAGLISSRLIVEGLVQ